MTGDYLRPPNTDPSTPRRIARLTPDPIDRAALFAADSSRPSWCPPRGPVVPSRIDFNASAAVGSPPVDDVAGGAAGDAFASVRVFSCSYADSRSMVLSYCPYEDAEA